MRAFIVLALGVFICTYSIYDSLDGEFTIAYRSGGGRTIYFADNPSGYRKAVAMQSLLGVVAFGFGVLMYRANK